MFEGDFQHIYFTYVYALAKEIKVSSVSLKRRPEADVFLISIPSLWRTSSPHRVVEET